MASVVETLAEKYEVNDPDTPTVEQLGEDSKATKDVEWEKEEEKEAPVDEDKAVEPPPDEKAEDQSEEKAKEKPPEISSHLIDQAIQMGIDPSTARSFSSDRDLTTAISIARSVIPPTPTEPDNTTEDVRIAPEFAPFEMKYDDEEVVYVDDVKKNLSGLSDHVAKQMQLVAERQEQIIETIVAERTQRGYEWFDQKVRDSTPEVKAILGERSTNSYRESDKEFEPRFRLMQAINRTLNGDDRMSPDKAFEREIRAEFPVLSRQEANKKQKSQSIGRPTSKDTDKDSDESALDRLQRRFDSYSQSGS